MILTRAQIVGLYGIMMNLPTDTEAEVQSVDDFGHAIVEFKSERTGSAVRYRLMTQGGQEVLVA